MARIPKFIQYTVILSAFSLTSGCLPTVKLEAPDEPVKIDLSVKVKQEIELKISKQLDKLIKANPGLF